MCFYMIGYQVNFVTNTIIQLIIKYDVKQIMNLISELCESTGYTPVIISC